MDADRGRDDGARPHRQRRYLVRAPRRRLGLADLGVLPAVPEWRWMLERRDTPWYASARLFRQRHIGDWPTLFGQVASASNISYGSEDERYRLRLAERERLKALRRPPEE